MCDDHDLTAAYMAGRAAANDEIRELRSEIERLRAVNDRLCQASSIYRAASLQGHSSHWDPEGTGGRNGPECIRADKLRKQAHAIAAEAARGDGE